LFVGELDWDASLGQAAGDGFACLAAFEGLDEALAAELGGDQGRQLVAGA
jgi:hypothetical protein